MTAREAAALQLAAQTRSRSNADRIPQASRRRERGVLRCGSSGSCMSPLQQDHMACACEICVPLLREPAFARCGVGCHRYAAAAVVLPACPSAASLLLSLACSTYPTAGSAIVFTCYARSLWYPFISSPLHSEQSTNDPHARLRASSLCKATTVRARASPIPPILTIETTISPRLAATRNPLSQAEADHLPLTASSPPAQNPPPKIPN